MEITRVVGGDESIQSVLDAIARTLTETVGFAGVVINVYRPQWDDFEAATVVGSPAMVEDLLGATYEASWINVVLDERFDRRGAYFIPEGSLDWEAADIGARYLPQRTEVVDDGAWRPGDELFVPCRDADGGILAIISLGEPVSGMRATDHELDFLVAVGRHAALALEQAHRTHEARRHRAALEHLLGLSRKLAEKDSIEPVLQAVCDGVRQALGFGKVVLELNDGDTGTMTARASAGWPAGQEPRRERTAHVTDPLMAPEFAIGGGYPLSHQEGGAPLGPAGVRRTQRQRRRPPPPPRRSAPARSAPPAPPPRGPATACSCRCATRPARSSGGSGPTSRRTGCCRRRPASRRSRSSPVRPRRRSSRRSRWSSCASSPTRTR